MLYVAPVYLYLFKCFYKMKIILLLILVMGAYACEAQEFTIANRRLNILYVGVYNEVEIAVNKFECKDVKLILSYGKLEHGDKPCHYTIKVDSPGEVKMSLYAKDDNRLIGETTYRAKRLPNFIIDRHESSNVRVRADELSLNLETNRKRFFSQGDSSDFRIKYFVVSIVRCNQELFTKDIKGAIGDDEVKMWFSRLKPGDRVFFEEIEAYAPDGTTRRLGTISFVITY